MPPRYTLEDGAICADGVRLLCLVRAVHGDGGPTARELEAARRDVGAALALASAPLPALRWMVWSAVDSFTENQPRDGAAGDRGELRDLIAALDWLEAAGAPDMDQLRGAMPDDATCARILAYEDPPPAPADPIRDALEAAERFISGFEGDELQDDMSALGKVRAALRTLKGAA